MGRRVAISIPHFSASPWVRPRRKAQFGRYQSAFMRVELAPDQPALVALAVDSLGKNKLSVSPLRPPAAPQGTYALRRVGSTFEYRARGNSRRDAARLDLRFLRSAKFICARILPEGIRLPRWC